MKKLLYLLSASLVAGLFFSASAAPIAAAELGPPEVSWEMASPEIVRFNLHFYNPDPLEATLPVSGEMHSQEFGVFLPNYGLIGVFDIPPIEPESFFDVVLTFDGTQFPECAEDITTCYLAISSNDPDEPMVGVEVDMWPGRGDVVSPFCWIDVGDVVFLVNYVFRGGPTPTPFCMGDCDPSHDGVIDLADVVYLVQYLFEGGLPPLTTPQMHQPANMR